MASPINIQNWVDAVTKETSPGCHEQMELSEYERNELILYLGEHIKELDGSVDPKHVKRIARTVDLHRQLNS